MRDPSRGKRTKGESRHAHEHDHAHPHEHDHAHPHEHDHAHPHGHEHGHTHPHPREHGHVRAKPSPRPGSRKGHASSAESHREALPPGAGEGRVLYLDAATGIAGDMTTAALVDLGVPFSVVEDAIAPLGLRGATLVLSPAQAGSIGASRFDVLVSGRQSERHYTEIDRLIERAALPAGVRALARRIFRKLGEAEAAVHRIPLSEVHFHEVGAVDAIVDIVAAAACFEYLGADVVCSPLPLGRGFVECRHGTLPLPAPATVGCLAGVPTVDAGIDGELVTPTGAAIVATVASRFSAWPAFAPDRIGWGAGARSLGSRPNALRAVLGTPSPRSASDAPTHAVLEANLDDTTGELVGHAIGTLLASGALDAWAAPVTMKKGRPGVVLSALCRHADASRIAEVVLRETSSIGVRWVDARRVERPRETITVSTRFGDVPVKVSAGPFGPPVAKPEFDASAELARAAKVPVRVVLEEARRAIGEPLPTAKKKTKRKG
ncbi:MAG TPA: nickel pincer cofactor biosynthesis protein LarC [Polyangiaceae bacterium]|nr:nickel pincer cofactor biosynthesis protein LarC [Polyangiaceae bacterium]